MPELMIILMTTVVAPTWIVFHYITKMKEAKGMTPEDETMIGQIWESANRMEERIHTLERILDTEHPQWRQKA